MKRTMLMIVLMLVLNVSFTAAQEVEIPVIFDRSWIDQAPLIITDPGRYELDRIKGADLKKSEIAVSPDGEWIAFINNQMFNLESRDIWIVSVEGGEPRKVYEIPDDQLFFYTPDDYQLHGSLFTGTIESISFSPDGDEITFCREYYDASKGSVYEFTEKTAASFGNRRMIPTIESVNITTGEVRTLIDEGSYPSWSADGRYLAYIHHDHMIYLNPSQASHHGVPAMYDTETGETEYLFDVNSTVTFNDPDPFIAHEVGKKYSDIVLTEDNSEAICYFFEIDNESITSKGFSRISIETREETIVPIDSGSARRVNLSPDGRYLVYSGLPFGYANMLFDLETNETIRALTDNIKDWNGVITPDGGSLIYLKYYDFKYASSDGKNKGTVGSSTMLCRQPIDPSARFASGITGLPPEIPDDFGILPEFGTRVSDKEFNIHMTNGPIWSPDGESVIITDESGKIWAESSNGGEEKLIYDNPTVMYQDYPLSFPYLSLCGYTPDGKEILFAQDTLDEERGSVPEFRYTGDRITGVGWRNALEYLYAVNVETGTVRTVVIGAFYGVYSPDGRYLAYSVNQWGSETGDAFLDEHKRQIIIRNLDTGAESFLPLIYNQIYQWTADSSALMMGTGPTIFSRVPIDGSNAVNYEVAAGWQYSVDSQRPFMITIGDEALFSVNYVTGEKIRITPDVAGEFWYPSLSPDGTKLAYVVSYEGANLVNKYDTITRRHVFVMDIDPVTMFPTAVEDVAPAPELVIGNYPNPFNPTTAIIFSLPGDGMTQLDIYNLSGQKVRELVYGRMNKGVHIVSWDGHTTDGSQAASGIYIARISMENHVATRRMTLMK